MARILIWAVTNCASMGSFEDFLVGMGRALSTQGHEAHIATGDGASPAVCHAFAAAGIVHRPLPIADMQHPMALAQMAKQIDADLVHTHFLSVSAIHLHNLNEGHPCALIVTDHASSTFEEAAAPLRNRLMGPIRRAQLPRIDHLIGVSDFVVRRDRQWFWLGARRATRIYNGIDLARFVPPGTPDDRRRLRRNAPEMEEDGQIIGYVGQLIPEKGIDLLLEIAQEIAENPSRQVVIVGDGIQARDVKAVADTHPRITYLGRRDDVPALLPFFDALLVPSVWPEAFGLVAAEALAVGVPVIAQDTGGLSEVIGTDDDCGVLVRDHSAKTYCAALEQVLDPAGYEAKRRAARARAEKLFAIPDKIDDTIAIYTKALSEH